MLTFKVCHGRRIGLEINLLAGHKAKHHTFGVKAGAAEHTTHSDGAERQEQVADEPGIHAAAAYDVDGTAFLSVAGVSCTDSPHPHALVWFGLLNTNWADSFSVL